MSIDPETIQFLQNLALVLFGPCSAYAVNQLLPIQAKFPGKNFALLIFIAAWVAAIAIWQWSLPEDPTPLQLQIQIWLERFEEPCYLLLVGSFLYLLVMSWRVGHTEQAQVMIVNTWKKTLFSVMQQIVKARLENELYPIKIDRTQNLSGCLLILGEAGVGKTTNLLKFAQDCLEEVKQDSEQPVPILFELSAWKDDKKDITNWLAIDLKSRYGTPLVVTKTLLKWGAIIPLFDGLDELGLYRQAKCIDRLNDFLKRYHFPVVVCCRYEEYIAGTGRLNPLRRWVHLKPFSHSQIQAYLKQRKSEHLWSDVCNDPEGLLALASIPLFLKFIVDVYPKGIPQLTKGAANPNEKVYYQQRRVQLLDAYINYKLSEPHNNQGYTKQQTKRYLRWLARQMKERKHTEFLIKNIRTDRLARSNYFWLYQLLTKPFISVVITSFCMMVSLWTITSIFGGLVVLILGFIYWLWDTLYGIDLSSSSIPSLYIKSSVVLGVMMNLLFGLIITVSLLFGPETDLLKNENSEDSTYISLMDFFGIVLVCSLIVYPFFIIFGYFLGYQRYELGFDPMEYITKIILLSFGYPNFSISFLKQASIRAIPLALFMGCLTASVPIIQHYSLRFVLCLDGAVPWRYARFLTYAHNRKLLKQVGGRYRFFHDLLRDHFAGFEIEASHPSTNR